MAKNQHHHLPALVFGNIIAMVQHPPSGLNSTMAAGSRPRRSTINVNKDTLTPSLMAPTSFSTGWRPPRKSIRLKSHQWLPSTTEPSAMEIPFALRYTDGDLFEHRQQHRLLARGV